MTLGSGDVILLHQNGWSCSKEAMMDLEFDIRPDKTARKTVIVGVKNLFNVSGELIPKEQVNGVFRYENGNKVAFSAIAIGSSRFEVTGELNNDFETILNKISQWQEQFKES